MIRPLIAFLLLASTAFGQIDISWTTQKSVTGLVNPRTVGTRILVADESNPVASRVAIVKVVTAAKFVKLSARKSLFEFADLEKLSDNEWLITAPGKYLVEAVTFDPATGIDERRIEITFGEPEPVPPPKPDPVPPPKPNPVPADEFGNIGQRASLLAVGLPKVSEVAVLYRNGAKRLASDPTASIDIVSAELRDRRLALLGAESTKYAALIAEIKKEQDARWPMGRGVFASFYAAIATGLEAVK